MIVRRYQPSEQAIWDDFVAKARNRHFFFFRRYMDYHRKRFTDASLLFFDEKERLLGLLPANIDGDTVVSHGGLTFGSVIVGDKMTTRRMLDIFTTMREYYASLGCRRLIYKCIPYIYTRYPSEEDRYALFRADARLTRRDISSTIYLPERIKYDKLRKRMVKKSQKNGVIVRESNDFFGYFLLLDKVLTERHGVHPVHSADEMMLLARNFPENIKLYVAEKAGKLLAGTVLFLNGDVVHTQYMADSDDGCSIGALDGTIDFLIQSYAAKGYRYFDFGISNEQQGRILNEGLILQKEGFGGRGVAHDFYEVDF